MPEAIDDPRFNTLKGQRENRAAAVALLDEYFAKKTYAEWDAILKKTDVAYERTARLLEVTQDPQALENGYFIERHYLSGKVLRIATPPFRMEGVEEDMTYTLHFGEHTREVLGELGYEEKEIEELYQNGSVL